MHWFSTSIIAAASLAGMAMGDSHCDTRYGTKEWSGPYYDKSGACGKGNYEKCYPTEEDSRKLLFDQFDKAFDELCKDVSCEGSFPIYFPGSGCDSKGLSKNKAYDLVIESEYTFGDRDGVKEAFNNVLQKLNKVDHSCNRDDTPGVNTALIKIPTDINIVRDTGDHGLRSFMHIKLDTGGEDACGVINDVWGALGGSIPGGNIFGLILKGACH